MFLVRFGLVLLALPLPLRAGPPPAEPSPGAPDLPPVPVVKLAPQASGPAPRALRYSLLPLRGDLRPGNAAPLWIRAGHAGREVTKKLNYDWTSTPVKDLPKKEVRAALDAYASALRLAEEAAHRERCDWELPPYRFDHWDFPFSELQGCRELAQALSVRCRLELSEGDFDRAARTLRTGLALARHLGDSDTMIQALVGVAIAAVMFGLVEEWMQIPGSPNLYWSLTALPVPFIDVRRSIEFEFNNLDQAMPQLRELRENIVSDPEQVEALVGKLLKMVIGSINPTQDWQGRLGLAVLAAKYAPDARRSLLAAGWKAERLDAMSPLQIVLVHWLDENDHYRDEVVKALALPPWQGRGVLEGVEREIKGLKERYANPVVTLLFSAPLKVYEARTRLERTVAGLRCAEALRLYAAAHDGKAPDKFADLTAVPLPVDPYTGKGFDGFYSAKEGRGVLDVPTSMPRTPQLGRRFEIGPGR